MIKKKKLTFLKARTIFLDHCLDDKCHHRVKGGFAVFATFLLIPDDFKRKQCNWLRILSSLQQAISLGTISSDKFLHEHYSTELVV